VVVDRLIVAGEPADEIHRIARERDYGFIVVGTQGLRGSRHMFFGSTTEQLLRVTEVPLLAIPPRAPGKPQSNWPRPVVGCAVDLDAHLRDDVRTAAHYARMFGAKLTVMHAVKSASTPAWLRARRGADPRLKSAETEVVSATRNPDIAPAPDVRILAGSPAEAVASFAKREVRLVILKLRRGTGLLGSRPGTITYQLLTISTVPVLALPASSTT
jgi:nucleotide-binding universal stress UspA family protein